MINDMTPQQLKEVRANTSTDSTPMSQTKDKYMGGA
eukprot:CAMPEP_0168623386 /NCGR_PEP_ID=MMETSP0449_2-20121227/8797_1 /TAXON_ID=1082188 /ORGANISM="Strombidium rassoulzadegani, Strain ras09" /LENGTH=35 /DNA_ID= /DNA_START= /DNA_END= /DNA_ORIENTATION=